VNWKDVKTWHISSTQNASEAAKKKHEKHGDYVYSPHGIPNEYFPTSNQTPYKFAKKLDIFSCFF
jgi:hypothetical protein